MSKHYELITAPNLAEWQDAWAHQTQTDQSDWELIAHPKRLGQGWLRHRQNGTRVRYAIQQDTQNKGHLKIWLNGQDLRVSKVSPQQHGTSNNTGAFRETLQAPMPGKIIGIHAKPGDTLDAKQTVIVMESMKMELSLTVEAPCQVRDILVSVGEIIEMNTTLARFEAIPL